MIDARTLIEQTLVRYVASNARVTGVRERSAGAQGYSGATLRYYDATYALPDGNTASVALVLKDAPLGERRVLAWLADQHQPHVPWSHTDDLVTDAPALVCMQDVGGEQQPPHGEMLNEAAEALAAIHAVNLGKIDQLPWLPRADRAYWERFIDACWREPWQRTLRNEAFTDAFGNEWPRSTAGGSFADEFGAYTTPLEAAAANFVDAMDELWQAGDAGTLVHSDIHSEHVVLHMGRAYVIDWGQACYGPLYLDLPNYFQPDHVLLYRAALATHGHDIPMNVFLQRYDQASRYAGFKYFGLGLWSWRAGEPQRHESMRYWIDMVLGRG